jgi:hypothetical protein
MSRKREPALYELISQKQTQSLLKNAEGTDPLLDDLDLDHNVITPGRSVRMPLGTIGVFVAVGIALIMISYMLGFRKGSSEANENYANRLIEQQSAPEFSEVEPIATADTWTKVPVLTPEILPKPEFATSPMTSEVAVPSTSTPVVSSMGLITSDPRISGMWYFTLVTTTESGATKLATFCRARGLETYVINSDNTRLYRVIALPGSTEWKDAKMVETLSKIHAIGRKWAGTTDGRGSDLRDAYPSLKKNPSFKS